CMALMALMLFGTELCGAQDAHASDEIAAATEAATAEAATAEEAATLDSGDTAWMLTATVLVLFMTIPGLALFYGGMVRSKNILSILMQCFAITCLMAVLWHSYGYRLVCDSHGTCVKVF